MRSAFADPFKDHPVKPVMTPLDQTHVVPAYPDTTIAMPDHSADHAAPAFIPPAASQPAPPAFIPPASTMPALPAASMADPAGQA